jgi:hypothetical protein
MAESEATNGETWGLLPNAEGRYEVSDMGRIRSLMGGSRAGTIRRKRPLLMKPFNNGAGYRVINLRLNGAYHCRGVASLVLLTFAGPKPAPHYQAAHLNGRRQDNRFSNLLWATPKENDSHKDMHNTRRVRPVRVSEGEELYRCTRCKYWLPRVAFRPLSANRRTRCGISSWCKNCEKSVHRDRKRQSRETARLAAGHALKGTSALPHQCPTDAARARADRNPDYRPGPLCLGQTPAGEC